VRYTLRLPFVSIPSPVAQRGVYLIGCCRGMQRRLFLHSQCRTSISDYPFPKPSPWHDSGQTNCSEKTTHRPLGNSHLPPAKGCVSAPAGKSDSSQGGSSVASTIPGQNSTPSSSLNNSGMTNIPQHVIVTLSTTQRRSPIFNNRHAAYKHS
jgi:hypothetical protein